ncbi:MAG: hypothetical protein OHK0019_02080 [Saprospiraceae bacterium]
MRNTIQTAGLLALLFFSNEMSAQIQNVWVGGVPGSPIDWNVAANWSLQRVPNEFHDVVIPNTSKTTFSYPVIVGAVEVHTLRVESGARLYILETGTLHLHAVGKKMNEVLANKGEIDNQSPNLIGFDDSVFQENNTLFSAKK